MYRPRMEDWFTYLLTYLFTAVWRYPTDVQYVADDANTPHVGGAVNRVEAHHLRSHELRRSEHHPRLRVRVVVPREAEVDDFDTISAPIQTQNVLRLQVAGRASKPQVHRISFATTSLSSGIVVWDWWQRGSDFGSHPLHCQLPSRSRT